MSSLPPVEIGNKQRVDICINRKGTILHTVSYRYYLCCYLCSIITCVVTFVITLVIIIVVTFVITFIVTSVITFVVTFGAALFPKRALYFWLVFGFIYRRP